jgi:hypothetical protein
VSDQPRIVLVGHCVPDSYALKAAIAAALPGATVDFATNDTLATDAASTADLLLINRILEGDFENESGIDLITKLGTLGRAKLMLISNYADAQAKAEQAGAQPGFGKRALYSEQSRTRVRAALGRS